MTEVRIEGCRHDSRFQEAKLAGQALEEEKKRDYNVVLVDYCEHDWMLRLEDLKRTSSRKFQTDQGVVICQDSVPFESPSDFFSWIGTLIHWEHKDPNALEAIAKEAELRYRQGSEHDFVYMDVKMGEEEPSRIVFELYKDSCPKTAENFLHLCIGDKDSTSRPGTKLTYKGSLFHRIQPKGWAQGGDIVSNAGDEGESIFGGVFEDENFHIKHDKRGILSMSNHGIHTNHSQFFLTFRAMDWLDTKYVAFGQIYRGSSVLDRLEAQETYNQRPKEDCIIVDCGLFPQDEL